MANTQKKVKEQPQAQAEQQEQRSNRLSEQAHLCLAMMVMEQGGKTPKEEIPANSFHNEENISLLKELKMVDESGKVTPRGYATILRNLNPGVNFQRLVGSLTQGAKFKLLFVLTQAIKAENKEFSIKLNDKNGNPNGFYDAVKEASDILYDLLEEETDKN